MQNPLVGIIGGMGPFASAEFIKTLYELHCPYYNDQSAPRIICISDTNIPDRTNYILSNKDEEFLNRFLPLIYKIQTFNIDALLILCITLHYYYEKIPKAIKDKTINLLTIIQNTIAKHKRPSLLLATNGTYQSRMLQGPYTITPRMSDQKMIHEFIYNIKKEATNTCLLRDLTKFLLKLVEEYETNSVVCGCTELHLLTKYLIYNKVSDIQIIDPLLVLAEDWKNIHSYTNAKPT